MFLAGLFALIQALNMIWTVFYGGNGIVVEPYTRFIPRLVQICKRETIKLLSSKLLVEVVPQLAQPDLVVDLPLLAPLARRQILVDGKEEFLALVLAVDCRFLV